MQMEQAVREAVQRGASDVHIKSGDVIRARVNGDLVPLTEQPLSSEQARSMVLQVLSNDRERQQIDEFLDHDLSWEFAGVGRFRVSILRQRGALMMVMRVIPIEIPTFEQLGLPAVVSSIAKRERGLVLVTGITGSGKSSTQAAMIGYMNQHMTRHVLTLENPIEFLHSDINSSITQREVGADTESFHAGLRAALRQDPDVILIGEMRDPETIDTAMKAAETGHLVISTVHTSDATATVSRLVSMFPPAEQDTVRLRLAETLQAVISQRLLSRRDGSGRALAAEVMMVTGAIRDCIVDPGRLHEIRDHMAAGSVSYGMQTFDQALMKLFRAGEVEYAVAKAAATNPNDFELQVNMLSGAGGAETHRRSGDEASARLSSGHGY